jgi:hypothetical protein
MIRHRCPTCHHMMDSSLHLVGLHVPCHVCGESLVVPEVSSSESSSYLRAQARVGKADAPSAATADEVAWERIQQIASSISVRTWWLAGVGVVVACAGIGCAVWWATR